MAIPKINTGVGLDAFDKLALLNVFICERDDWDTKAELVDMVTTPVWKDLGQAKTGEGANFEIGSTTVPITTLENGNTPHGEIISDLTAKVTLTLAQVNQTVRQYVTDFWTATGVENSIGQFTKNFSIRLHPSENGTDYSKDVIIPRCSIKTTDTKASELGQYANLKLEVSAIFDTEVVAGKSILVLTDLA